MTRVLTDGVVGGTVAHSFIKPNTTKLKIKKNSSPADIVTNYSNKCTEESEYEEEFSVEEKTANSGGFRECFSPVFGEGD